MKNLLKDGRKVPAHPTRPARKGKKWQLVKRYFTDRKGTPLNSQGVPRGRGWQGCWWWAWKEQNGDKQRAANAAARKRQRAARKGK